MARISQYDQDSTLNKLDKVLGTDSATGATKNYSIDSMISLVNSDDLVDVFDGVSYAFKDYAAGSTTPKGIISLNAGTASEAAFSAINQIYISVLDKQGNSIANYLDDTLNGQIRIVQKSNIDVYGVFEVTAVANHDSAAYKKLTVTPKINNGNITVNGEYFISNFSALFNQDFSTKSVTEFSDVTNAGSGQIITSTERTNLTGLQANALLHADVVNNVTSTGTDVPLSAAQGKVLKDLIDTINTLLTSDNTDLDSLQEVVDFIEANKSTLDSLSISNIAGLQAALDAKQATETGKGLSANDFTTALLTKLNGIAASAEVNVQANFNETSSSSDAFIQNKPTDLTTLSAHNVTELSDITSAGSGSIISSAERTKLTGIETSADVTDTANVTSAGALMDSEVTNLAQVKAFSTADYATAAQGAKADSAQQPPSEGAFVNGDKTKLDGIESNADVTDAANVTTAGALMDSELANVTAVKAINQGLTTTDSVEFNNITQQGHRAIKHSDAVKTLVVKVITKTAAHPEHGNGSSNGYTIDDIEGAYLEFTPGNTYKFDQSDSSNANHPLRFYEDAAKATAYTTGVTTSGTPGSSSAYTQIIPTTSTPPILFYQCSAHSLMGSYVKFGTGTIGDTYSIDVTQDGNNVDLKLDAASGTDSTVQLTAGSNITLTRNDAQQVTIAASGGGVTIQEEGSSLSTAATTLNFTGAAVTASGSGATKTIDVTGGAITVQEEGSSLSTAATTLNFTGSAVTASGTGTTKTINITGFSSSGNTVTIEKNVYTGDGSDLTFDAATTIANENNVQVYIDGVYQSKDTYTTSGSTVTFGSGNAPANGSSVELIHMVAVDAVIARDSFTGNNSTTAYVLSKSISNENATQVYLDGVYQSKDNYSTSGSTLTFSTAPPNGAAIEVVHIKASVDSSTQWQSAIKTADFTASAGEGYFVNTTSGTVTVSLPAGSVGDEIHFTDYASTFDTNEIIFDANGSEKIQGRTTNAKNTTEGATVRLIYQDATKGWTADNILDVPNTFALTYLVVAGGGGGGHVGGGGAGGYRTNYGGTALNLLPSTNYTVTVGGGGAASTSSSSPANAASGSNSVFSDITSAGGGYGGANYSFTNGSPASGGSGGGGPWDGTQASHHVGGSGNTPSTSPSQGNNGGSGSTSHPYYSGGGGGGAGAVGSNGSGGTGGAGGAGAANAITGSSVTYAGGGGGNGMAWGGTGAAGAGGSGGGGTGSVSGTGGGGGVGSGSSPSNGTTNLGGGGGSPGYTTSGVGAGGSGIVILRYPSSNSVVIPGGSGLVTGQLNATVSGSTDKYTTFTGGNGTIQFN